MNNDMNIIITIARKIDYAETTQLMSSVLSNYQLAKIENIVRGASNDIYSNVP